MTISLLRLYRSIVTRSRSNSRPESERPPSEADGDTQCRPISSRWSTACRGALAMTESSVQSKYYGSTLTGTQARLTSIIYRPEP